VSGDQVDIKYDTAAMRAYAANLVAVFDELRRGGMDRREALAVVCELVRTLAVTK
jgi:hypothetical protein